MKLYHFTSKHHIYRCLDQGLTMGTIPISIDPPEFIYAYQWMTKNKSFHQSWCDNPYSKLPYKRNDFRITIKFPRLEIKRRRLMNWLWFCKNSPDPKIRSAAGILNMFGDPENWYVYHGIVRKEWFIKVSKRPE